MKTSACAVTHKPVEGGEDIVIKAGREYRIYTDDGRQLSEVIVRVRKIGSIPRVGQRVTVCNGAILIKVKSVHYDQSGNCMVVDETTGAQYRWS